MPRRQRPHLVERASRQHGVETRVDPPVQCLAVGRKKYLCDPRHVEHRRHAIVAPIRDRAPGRLDDFERTRNSRPVRWTQQCRRNGIAAEEFGMERHRAQRFEP